MVFHLVNAAVVNAVNRKIVFVAVVPAGFLVGSLINIRTYRIVLGVLYKDFQLMLMGNPKAGDVIAGTGGLRKIRFEDKRRGKGKRGGLRVIYYYQTSATEFLLFTIYDKDEASDLTSKQKTVFKAYLESELQLRYPQ